MLIEMSKKKLILFFFIPEFVTKCEKYDCVVFFSVIPLNPCEIQQNGIKNQQKNENWYAQEATIDKNERKKNKQKLYLENKKNRKRIRKRGRQKVKRFFFFHFDYY